MGVSPEATVLLNVGRREFQKGQSTLLESLAVLRTLGERPQLWIAGREGNESEHLDDLVRKLELSDQVRFLGHVDDVPDLLVAADAFVFPSRFEGLGGAALEAMALGVPIIAGDVPALRALLDDGRMGLLVPVDAPDALAAAIVEVLRDPESAALKVARARTAFEARFTLDAAAGAMADWLREHSRPA
jgi:glycosyltransferase involved in cell wall biosynthesis